MGKTENREGQNPLVDLSAIGMWEEFLFSLEPRDVASACVIRECTEAGKGVATPDGRMGVWLDSPMIEVLHGEGTVKKELAAKYLQFKRFGIDISQEPMLVYTTLHY